MRVYLILACLFLCYLEASKSSDTLSAKAQPMTCKYIDSPHLHNNRS